MRGEPAFRSGLPGVYADLADRRPNDDALIFTSGSAGVRHYTWAQVMSRAVELAHWLRSEGVERGDCVAVQFTNSDDLIPALIAIWATPAVVVPVDELWGNWLRDHIVSHSGAMAVLSLTGAPCIVGTSTFRSGTRPQLPEDCAMISYTSGTASSPKGVILRHANLLGAYQGGSDALRERIGTLPHTVGCAMRMSGLGILGVHYLWAATMGASTVALPELSLQNVGSYWENMVRHDVRLTYLVPTLVALVNFAGPVRPPAATLPTVLSGGAPLPPGSQSRFQGVFKARLLNIYGLTEVAFAAFFGDVDEKGQGTPSVGRPATVRARLRGENGAVLEGPGEGELELAGDVLMDGYYDNEAATGSSVIDRWLRTGDIAEVDEAGKYRIVGRCKDVVLKGAFTIHLSEVEAAAQDLPGVVDAGALRLELPGMAEDFGLVVQIDENSDVDVAEVRKLLEQRLGVQRCPRRVVVIGTPLPKVGHGKLDRTGLEALWTEAADTRRGMASGDRVPGPGGEHKSLQRVGHEGRSAQ